MIAAAVELTPRQLQVIRAVLLCGCVKAGASSLGIAPDTAKAHLAEARSRTGTISLAQLVAWADDHCPGWRENVAA